MLRGVQGPLPDNHNFLMIDFCSYNVRGLNNKSAFIKDFISCNKFSLIGLLETRSHENVAKKLSMEIAPHFNWVFNFDFHPGGRIWLGWNPIIWDLFVISSSSQQITCSISHRNTSTTFFISFIYGFNTSAARRPLWSELSSLSGIIADSLWVLSGDFNVCLSLEEKRGGSIIWSAGMTEFKDCVLSLGLSDLRFTGKFLTWWDNNISSPKFRKLDRVLVNSVWLSTFEGSTANFSHRGLSDHSPAVINMGLEVTARKKPFQIFKYLFEHPDFFDIVKREWSSCVSGDHWFILTSKLKKVKHALKNLNSSVGNLCGLVIEKRNALESFQHSMPDLPSSDQFNLEKHLMQDYADALSKEECLLKQKSRVKWLNLGDNNNNFFFNYCKSIWNCNKIL